jgi:hypothetical protein
MIEGFERDGRWWLVDEPENKFHGTLKYNHKDGAILTISLSENSIAKYNAFKPYIILGEIDHEKITLVNCRFIGAGGIDPESRECIIIPETIFSGAHFYNTEDIKFISMDITYSCLDEWIDINSFSHSYSENGETIEYKKPDDIKVNIDGDINIVFTPITSAIILARYQKEAYIKQKWITRIEKKDGATLNEFLDIIKHLQTFLCLAIREPVHVLKLNAVPIMTQPDIDNPQEVGIFYRSIYISEPYKYFTGYMLFSYQDVITILYDMITNWFKNQELLKPICGLYFGILVNPYLYPENQFLNLTQAIEAFHKRVSTTRSVSLEKRIYKLIGKYGDIVPQLLMGREQDPKEMNKTRQHLTHYDEGSDKHAAKGKELLRMIYKLKVLLEVCLVMQTGINKTTAKELFSKNRIVRQEASGSILSG